MDELAGMRQAQLQFMVLLVVDIKVHTRIAWYHMHPGCMVANRDGNCPAVTLCPQRMVAEWLADELPLGTYK